MDFWKFIVVCKCNSIFLFIDANAQRQKNCLPIRIHSGSLLFWVNSYSRFWPPIQISYLAILVYTQLYFCGLNDFYRFSLCATNLNLQIFSHSFQICSFWRACHGVIWQRWNLCRCKCSPNRVSNLLSKKVFLTKLPIKFLSQIVCLISKTTKKS